MLRVFVALLTLAASALSQTTTASLSGTVSDATGGIVPGGKVVASTTSAAGNYALPLLPIGRHKIEVSFTG